MGSRIKEINKIIIFFILVILEFGLVNSCMKGIGLLIWIVSVFLIFVCE